MSTFGTPGKTLEQSRAELATRVAGDLDHLLYGLPNSRAAGKARRLAREAREALQRGAVGRAETLAFWAYMARP